MKSFWLAAALLPFSLFTFACEGNDESNDGGGGQGGDASGGESSSSGGNAAAGGSSSGGAASTGGAPNGGSYEPVGKADAFELDGDSTTEETAAAAAGSFEVAIFKAPSLDEIGRGVVTVSVDDGTLRYQLSGPSGSLVDLSVPLDDDSCADGLCVSRSDHLTTPLGGRRLGVRDYYAMPQLQTMQLEIHPDGFLSGTAGNDAGTQFWFRNDVLAFGPQVPSVFATLAGEYTGAHEANTCLPNPITFSVSDSGAISVQGKTSVSCSEQDLESTWDGQDDLIVPHEGGVEIRLESQHIGGSQPGGGLFLRAANALDASAITYFTSNFAGADGHITVPAPTKE